MVKSFKFLYCLIYSFLSFTENRLLKFFFLHAHADSLHHYAEP